MSNGEYTISFSYCYYYLKFFQNVQISNTCFVLACMSFPFCTESFLEIFFEATKRILVANFRTWGFALIFSLCWHFLLKLCWIEWIWIHEMKFESVWGMLVQQLLLWCYIIRFLVFFCRHVDLVHLHPSLYPVLMIFGQLCPSVAEGSSSTLDLEQLVPYVISYVIISQVSNSVYYWFSHRTDPAEPL